MTHLHIYTNLPGLNVPVDLDTLRALTNCLSFFCDLQSICSHTGGVAPMQIASTHANLLMCLLFGGPRVREMLVFKKKKKKKGKGGGELFFWVKLLFRGCLTTHSMLVFIDRFKYYEYDEYMIFHLLTCASYSRALLWLTSEQSPRVWPPPCLQLH